MIANEDGEPSLPAETAGDVCVPVSLVTAVSDSLGDSEEAGEEGVLIEVTRVVEVTDEPGTVVNDVSKDVDTAIEVAVTMTSVGVVVVFGLPLAEL